MNISSDIADFLMSEALAQAELAYAAGEVPVGAVAWDGKEIIARSHNLTEALPDPTAHAEILILRQVAAQRGNWRLSDIALCVTLEPCTMCMGAMRLARVPVVIFGAEDEKVGAAGSLYDLSQDERLGNRTRVISGIRQGQCQEVLKDFFRERRQGESENKPFAHKLVERVGVFG